ncbi:aspartate/glutamate racemase family protein [Rhizobium sp. NFACC06-2]|uniref:aspartate/glutamate racemase family protein n=1 Tax=Rhizobium sp. NFACC06-2 TaxID=1566264 RepID=UPI000876D677|nr:aspartate/glutamate racemase family protein [Rhizobium sp. NFACC06-2]SCY88755.1 aspartate racemase [Rhizobium sp. NFACC06-2]
MKTIGILGGMSAASTQIYYRELCRLTRETLGGLHSPELLIRSVDFDEIERLQVSSNWDAAADILNEKAIALERGGAELLIMATNTMHKVADRILAGLSIPFVHIADATATAILDGGFRKPGLMATAFTMEQNFYTDRLTARALFPTIPEAGDRAETHRIIYDELCRDVVTKESRLTYELIAQRLINRGCDCLILGCTEVGMLLNQDNVAVPVFDTTLIHCEAALRAALD